jgi:hypothetical protein
MFLLLALTWTLSGPASAGPWAQTEQAVEGYAAAGLCGGEGARCVTNLDCCRGSCVRMICRRGPIFDPCKANGASCGSSNECCSRFCLGNQCQPRIEP